MDLSDYNKSDIKQIESCKNELLEILGEYEFLITRTWYVFEKFKNIKFSKRVQNPCNNCLVKPSCEFKNEIEQGGIPNLTRIIHKKFKVCHPKIKSLIISKMKMEIKKENFINKNLFSFHKEIFNLLNIQNPADRIYPKRWSIE